MILKQATMQLVKPGVMRPGKLHVKKLVKLWEKVGLCYHHNIDDKTVYNISHFNSGRSVLKNIKTSILCTEYMRRLFDILGDWTFTEEQWNSGNIPQELKNSIKVEVDELQREIDNGK
jgi:hypothetical protein